MLKSIWFWIAIAMFAMSVIFAPFDAYADVQNGSALDVHQSLEWHVTWTDTNLYDREKGTLGTNYRRKTDIWIIQMCVVGLLSGHMVLAARRQSH